MADILSLVPGLPGVISARVDPSEILNLRLVLSASELAVLPFELSKIPAGGGAPPDNWLLLHANAPVCLTRHNRAVRTDNVVWPTRPRILYAYGEDVPNEEHYQALVAALRPWTGDGGNLDDWLTVVPTATLPQLNEISKTAAFTHVHILAHGAPYGDTAFGVALKDSVVTGRELAAALFDVNGDGIHRPTVVTLATCDSGAQGSVVNAPDVSVAHDLHEAGIPLVIASQFPLSADGSGKFIKLFYSEQLAGTHPLLSVYRSRLMLHAYNASRFHDWASLVVYEALPANLEDQLYEVQYAQKRAVLERALSTLEDACNNESWTSAHHACFSKEVEQARGQLPEKGPYAAECVGLRAASWKRAAHVDYTLALRAPSAEERETHAEACYLNLQRALQAYVTAAKSFLVNVSEAVHRKATLEGDAALAAGAGAVARERAGEAVQQRVLDGGEVLGNGGDAAAADSGPGVGLRNAVGAAGAAAGGSEADRRGSGRFQRRRAGPGDGAGGAQRAVVGAGDVDEPAVPAVSGLVVAGRLRGHDGAVPGAAQEDPAARQRPARHGEQGAGDFRCGPGAEEAETRAGGADGEGGGCRDSGRPTGGSTGRSTASGDGSPERFGRCGGGRRNDGV
jgi:hypothetical protein